MMRERESTMKVAKHMRGSDQVWLGSPSYFDSVLTLTPPLPLPLYRSLSLSLSLTLPPWYIHQLQLFACCSLCVPAVNLFTIDFVATLH